MQHRYFLFLMVSLSASLSVGAQGKIAIDSSYANNHFKQRLAFFKLMPDEKKEIVFLGNSITEAGEWQELIPGKKVKNRGISGDVTYGVLARLDEVLSSKPAKIFLLIGINDVKRGIPPDTVAYNYQRIVDKIRNASPNTALYIQSILPVNETMLSQAYKNLSNAVISVLNEKLAVIALQNQCSFVNLHEVLKDDKGQLIKAYTTDGIHLWPSTYIRWVNYLKHKKYL